jgi:putative ABC transport system permease protein
MFNLERWQEIFQAISKNKLRTFLTGISVASGIFILVILLGAGKGLQNGIEAQFSGDATTLLWISPGYTSKGYKGLNPNRLIQFRFDDYKLLEKEFKDHIDLKSPMAERYDTEFVYGKEVGKNYYLKGCYSDVLKIEAAQIISGRNLNKTDEINSEKVIVIGNKIKKDLFKEKDPVGEYVFINSIPFKVIGYFSNPKREWKEDMVFTPLSTYFKVFGQGDKLNYMAYTIKNTNNPSEMIALSEKMTTGIKEILKRKHDIAPDDESALQIYSTIEQTKDIGQMLFMINLFFWWVGICTIIAGVVGVSNVMLIIVKERTKEIGIRKALGARPISIITMILQESIFITIISGFIGLLTSLVLLEIISPMVQSEFFQNPEVDFNVALTTVGLLVFAGALSGFIPAYRAAKIKPIVALKDE